MFEVIAIMLLSQQPLMPVLEGKASFYTVASSGSVTASGERLKDTAFTCAMLQGDFGDSYTVVGENGKSVVVRLTDRGPYVKGRVIDLSKAAMEALGGEEHLMNVKVYRNADAPRAPS